MPRSPRIAPTIYALRSARKRWRGPIATIALFAIMAGGFALVRASAGDRFASFQWPESLSRIFGSRTARALSPAPFVNTYYSQGSLDPTVFASWNTVPLGGGASPPNFTSGDAFIIQNTHNMTTGAAWSISGSGSQLIIQGGGTLTATNAVTLASATFFQILANGNYVHSNTSGFASTILAGSESLDSASNFVITNSSTTGPSNGNLSSGSFGNITVNLSTGVNIQCGGNLTSIAGNLTIQNTPGSEFRLTSSASPTITIGGNLILSGGSLALSNGSGSPTVNVTGDFSLSSGTLQANSTTNGSGGTGAATLNVGEDFSQTGGVFTTTGTGPHLVSFTGGSSSVTFTRSAGTFTITNYNWSIASGKTVQFNSLFLFNAPRTFTVASGGALVLAAAFFSGSTIINGELRLASGAVFNGNGPTYGSSSLLKYQSGTTYSRNNEWSANSGLGYPNDVQLSNNTTLDLGANSGTSTARSNGGSLTIDSGSTFQMAGTNPMTAAVTVAKNVANIGTLALSTSSGGNLNVGGNLANVGIATYTHNSRTLTFNGTSAQTWSDASSAQNFGAVVIDKASGAVNVSGTVNVTNLTVTAGTLGGTGTVVGPTSVSSGARVAPGTSPGILNTGDVTFSSGSNFDVEIGGTTAGTGYDQLNVTGTVTLGSATLNLTPLAFTPVAGNSFKIINNDDNSDAVSGVFTMGTGGTDSNGGTLAEGDTITNFLGSPLNATITYAGGSGSNDVVLTAVAAGQTISGTVLQTGGVGVIASGRTISLWKNGAFVASDDTDALGQYSISGVTLGSGDRLAVFLDDETEKGATVTLSAASDISNLDIWQNALIVRHDNAGPITNANLSNAQGGVPDADLTAIYTVTGSDLTTPAGVSLMIWNTSTYAPGGNISDGGNWTNNGTFTSGSNTVTFNGTANQSIGGNNSTTFATLAVNPTNNAIVSLAVNTTVGTALNIQAGVFSQGESGPNDFSLTTNTATVSSGATWKNLGKGDLTLTGDVSNSGTINFNSNGTTCGDADDILIRSSSSPTQRTWSGTGTFSMTDVDVQDQKVPGGVTLPLQILVNDGTGSAANNTGWSFVNTCAGPYTWVGGANQDWTIATNWSPLRTTAATTPTTDQLIFDGNVTPTPIITNVPSQQIATLSLRNNNISVTLRASGTNTLTIAGSTGNDLSIPAGTSLNLETTNALTVTLLTGSAANVDGLTPGIRGAITLLQAAHRLTAADANALTFKSGASFVAGSSVTTGFLGNPFGTGTNGSVVFDSGSTGFFNEGSDPFGGSGKSVTTFNLGSTARFGANSAFSTTDARSYGNLILEGNQTYAPSGSGETTVLNNFELKSGSTLTLSGSAGGDLNLGGNFADQNSAAGTFNANNRTVKFSGGAAIQTISKSSNPVAFFDVLISKTGGSVELNADVTINGALQFGGSAGSAVDVLDIFNGFLTLNGTIGSVPNANCGLKGHLNGATLIITGSGALGTIHFIPGSELLTSLDVNRNTTVPFATSLTIGQPSGTPFGTLDLTNGVVDMGSNTLSLNPNVGVGRVNGYVGGNLQRVFAAAASKSFDVGTANGFSPVTVNATAGTFPANFTVKAIQGGMPSVSGANKLARYWTLTNTTVTNANLTFNYLAGDVTGTAANYQFVKNSGGNLTIQPPTGTPTNTTATINGVSSFSDWTLAESSAVTRGTLAFTATSFSDTELHSSSHTVAINVSRTGGTDGAVSVSYQTAAVTATNGSDYDDAGGSLSWNDGEGGPKTILVTVYGDTTYEANETVTVTLSNPLGGATIGGTNPVTLTINNDDAPPATLVVNTTNDVDDGVCNVTHCSLREAINAANFNSDPSTINFNIPLADGGYSAVTGVFTIAVTGTPLPEITQRVTIDGATQMAFTGDTNVNGPEVVINGSALGGLPTGLYASSGAASSVIANLVVNGFTNGTGIVVWANNAQVLNNYIGTNETGTAAVPNAAGMGVGASAGNTSGYTISGNLISGNTSGGISSCDITGGTFSNNKIGTDRTGVSNLGNGGPGLVTACGSWRDVTISGNTIAFNSGDGFRDRPDYPNSGPIPGSGESNNHRNIRITQNSIFSNGEQGIDLWPPPDNTNDGVTPNDAGDADEGGNHLQNFPVITVATNGSTGVAGTLNTTPSTSGYVIEIFSNDACDPSNGEGKTYLGTVTTGATDGSGNVSWNVTVPALTTGQILTATATDAAGNTSEFSACFTVTAAPNVSIGDFTFAEGSSGGTTNFNFFVSLSAPTASDVVITYSTANGTSNPANGGSDYTTVTNGSKTILAGQTSGTIVISVSHDTDYERNETFFVNITNATNATVMDSQGLGTINNDDAPPTTLVVNTTVDTDDGFCFPLGTGNGCTLREAINAANFNSDPSTINFNIPLADGGYSAVTGVFTIAVTGTPLPEITQRVTIDGATQMAFTGDTNVNGPEVVINGSALGGLPTGLYASSGAASSVIANLVVNGFTNGTGIVVWANNAQVLNNYIGTNETGTAAVPNAAGMGVGASAGNTSGYTISGNLISGNTSGGISSCDITGGTFSNNKIGTDRTGVSNLGNGGPGLVTACGSWRDVTISGNTIAFNSGDGFRDRPDYPNSGPIPGSGESNNHRNIRITQNSIFSNGEQGIDLWPPPDNTNDGVTPNDAGDADEGGNHLQNFPVITVATNGSTGVAGTLNTTPSTSGYVIEIFSNDACDPSNGEGKTYLGTVTTGATDGSGNVSWNVTVPALTTGQILTATATDAAGNTSEFSACFTVTAAPNVSIGDFTFAEGSSGGTTNFNFFVSMTAPTATDVTVNYSTANGTSNPATGGTDYTSVSNGSIIIPAGQTSGTIVISVNHDTTEELNETFFVNISSTSPVNITDSQGLGTITNDDFGETNLAVDGSGNLVITDSNGGASNDTLSLFVSAGAKLRVQDPNNTLSCGAGSTQVNPNTCDVPLSSITGNIQVNTLGGNDTLTINYDTGAIPQPISYDGGTQTTTDKLVIGGGSLFANVTHTFNSQSSGSVAATGVGTVTYTGLEPVTDNMNAVDRVFTFTGGSELITLSDAAGANMIIDSTLGESVTFANPTGSLTINGGTGDDTITVSSVDSDGPFNVDLTINGDDGGDVVNLNADITFAAGENLDVNLTNDAVSGDVDAINVGTNANLVLSGSGAATLAGSYYIAMASGSSVTTVDGAITLNANTAGLTSGNFVGIDVNGATIQSTGTGNVTVTGKGGSAASSQYGVRVMGGGDIIGGTTGTATISGTGRGTGAGSANSGVFVTGAGSSISSNGASVQVTGTGGLGSLSSGIDMLSGGLITAGGSGSVTINGTGGGVSGTGAFNHGVIMGGATINSAGGNVSVTGTGGAGTGAAADFTGCHLDDSTITAGSSGTVTLNCTAGTAPTSQTLLGLDVRFTSQITSSGGNVSVTGTGGNTTSTLTSAGAGVRLIGNGTITAGGTGTVTVTGSGVGGSTTGHEGVVVSGFGLNTNQARIGGAGATTITAASGNGASHALALGIDNTGRITTSSDSPVTINADSVDFGAGAIVSSGTGATTIRQRTAGTFINLGGADVLSGSPLTLGLTDAELDKVTAGTLNIGNDDSGTITVSSDVTRPASTNMALTSGGDVTISGGQVNTGGGTLLLNPGVSPAAVKPTKSSTDVTVSTLSFGSDLAIAINGATVDTQYTQLNVVGIVNITGVSLVISGGYTPAAVDSFIIVNNDTNSDAVVGTFNGLPEGTLVNVNGTNKKITYVGGDGNDVVLLALNADLSVTKTDSPDPVTEGNALTYTLTVSNAGPDAATNVVLTDTLPVSVTFVSATVSQGSGCTGTSTITCNLGTIANAGNATVTIVVTPNTPGPITNNASVTATESDPNTPNNDSEGTVVNAAVCTPPPVGMVAWYPGDGNADDIQGPTFENGTLQGGATFGAGKVNQAFSLDGTDDYVEVADSPANSPTGAITIDAWVNPDTIAADANGRTIVSKADTGTPAQDYSYEVRMLNGGQIQFSVYCCPPTSQAQYVVTPGAITPGVFTHVAATFDSTTQQMKVYFNGVDTLAPLGGASVPASSIFDSTAPVRIGAYKAGASLISFFDGIIDEVEIFNTALSSTDIANIYNASFAGKCRTCTTPPIDMVSWWPFDETSGPSASDIAGPNNLTVSGATFTAGKVNNALNFDGTDDNAVVGSSATLESTTNALTVDAWVFWRGHTVDTTDRIVSKRLVGGNVSHHLVIINSQLTFGVNTGTLVNTVDPNPFPTNRWVHVAGTYDGSNLRLFRDGVQVSPTTPVTGTIQFDGGDLAVGWYDATFPEHLNGLIDELEIFNRALGQTEIAALANAGNAGKCHTSTVTVTVSPSSVLEDGATNLVYTFTRNGDISGALPVDFTVGGSATFGGPNADYTQTGAGSFSSSSGTVTFGSGSATATVTIDPEVDATDEPNEDVVLTVTAGAGYTIGSPNTATGTITDDDPTPSITIDDVSLAEGSGGGNTSFLFTVSLSNPSSSAVDVTFTTADNTAKTGDSDYTLNSGTLSIPANTMSGQITVLVGADTKLEPNETFFVDLTGATNGTITDSRGVGTIQNDDAGPTFSIDNVTMVEGDSGTTNFVFTVTKTGVTGERARVDFATANGTSSPAMGGGSCGGVTDYVSQTGTVTFTPAETTKTITVAVCGEMTVEGDETFFVNLSNPVNASITTGQGLGTITNDDTDVSVAVSPSSSGEDIGPNLVFTFTRNPLTPGPITVNFTVGGTATLANNDYTATGADTFTASSGTVTIPGGITTATVTIDPTADTDYEFDETVVLTITSGTGYNIGSPSAATGDIANDDNTIIVTKTADTNATCLPNDCSLREAINLANANSDFNNIFFDVSGAGCVSGVCTIQPGGAGTATPGIPLPAITTQVVIDGYSQPGSSVNLSATSIDAVLGIEIDGSAAGTGADGLVLDTGSGQSTIMGLVINRFDGNGIKVISSTSEIEIIGNFIGTNAAGTAAAANHVGIYINNSPNNIIGCTIPSERNLISGNTDEGIEIYGVSPFNATNNILQGNFIGTDKTGLLDVGNGGAGVKVYDGSDNIIGVDSISLFASGANVISGNGGNGVEIAGGVAVAINNTVYGNFIGTDLAGTADISNTGNGVAIYNASLNVVGSATQNVLGNVITNNDKAGVLIEEVSPGTLARRNAVRRNSIYNNGELGIDLTTTVALPGTGDGVTANDAGDGDPGANLQQNFPVITTADVAGTTISGTLDSTSLESFTIDVYDNDPGTCDASGNGEGKTYLGSATAVEGAPGQYTWSLTGLTPLVEGRVITATATDQVGNTSEFSKCFEVFKRVQFAQANTDDNETHTGSHAVNIVVTRTGGSGGTVDVNYAITDGSAQTGDNDYSASPSSGTLHWADGDTTPQNLVVTVNGDNKYEINEIVNLTLFSPVGAILGTPSAATLTIVNDDAAPTLSINDRSINEGTSPPGTTSFIFTVTKTGSTALTATVDFATADDTGPSPATGGGACGGSLDYQSQNNSLSFAANETSKTITVLVCKDGNYEANELFQVNLSGPGNATISDNQGLGTILNDDAPSTGYVVNSTADTDNGLCEAFGTNNGCTLREAINAANTSGTPVSISFEIPATDPGHYYYQDDGSGSPNGTVSQANIAVATTINDAALPANKDPDWPHGWWSIATTSPLPAVIKSVVIDGYSQIAASTNDGTVAGATNAVIRIEINGASAGANVDGLTLGSGSNSSIVRGMVINRFLRDSGAGTPAGNGINLTSGGAQSVTGNFIGTDVSGILDLGNGGAGVLCAANNVTVGGASLDAMNLISGNSGDGVAFSNSNSDVVQNNLIGTMANGVTALGNGGNGITFAGAGSLFNTLGGVAAVEGNTIRGNGADGVRLFDAGVGNGIRGNSIYANGSTANDLGIDLGADGVTANDALDADTGPNALQNFPVITSAIVTGSTKTITGTLNSTTGGGAGATFEIDFYVSQSCDNSGNGEGQVYLGTTEVTTDGSTGDVSFTFHPDASHSALMNLAGPQFITATATSTGAQFNTSEFSACFLVQNGAPGSGDIQFTSATYTVNENVPGGMAAITLTRTGGTNGQIQTTFRTTNLSATAPGDYTDSTQTVVFNEGETSKTVNVPIINDTVYEGNETVNLSVDSPPTINAAQRDTEIFFDPYAAVLTITENDPVPSFSIASVTTNEGDSGTTNFDLVITKTGATAVNAQVSYATADQTATGGSCGTAGVDYASQSLTPLTFLPAETTKTVTIQVCGDGTVEFDETFLVNLSNPVNATISSSPGTGTITNDDCPPSLLVNHAGDTHDSTPGDGVCLDSNQNCTLRAAIEEANALVGCAATIPINFAFAFETIIVLPLGELSVEHNVNINGPTAYSLTIDGNGNHRAFNIASDNTVTISNLTITDCVSSGDGGGILNTGTLTLNSVLVNGNSAVNGGGIASTTNNSLTLINTTISGNNSSVNGGGLYNDSGVATLTNVTIAYNTANSDNTGSGVGGGIFVASGDVTLHNTIVADNLKGPGAIADDISGLVNAASSYNVIGTGAGGLTNGGNNNQVGVASALLKPLQANGGPTQTHALTYKSPAVDLGDACVLTGCSGSSPVVTIDQRGRPRTPPNDGDDNGATGVDIGAYERQVTETRDVQSGFNSMVDIVDAIITFPCVLPCSSERANTGTAQRDSAIAPAAVQPTVSLASLDPATLNSLTRPPNLVIGNSSSPALPAFEVTTTASYTPPATVCFYLPSFTNPTFFAGLKVLHREAGPNTTYGDSDDVMVDRTRTTSPTDFANKLVCSEVSSFSAFAIAHTATPTATNGTVSGQILDSGGKPVEGAAVRMSGTQNRLTITDAQGDYHFDDVEINGLYVVTPSRANFSFSPAQRSFNQLGATTEATFTGAASGGVLNPLDTTEYFVRQQYVDFLGREPDEAGFNFWVRNIDTCANDFGCREVKRVDTSAAFFLSIEFQQTGYLVYRTYQAAYGDMPNAPVPLTLSEFKPDNLQISNRVVVLQDGWQQRLETNKRTFMDDFVQRRRFITAYPLTMTPTEFVDKLFANAGVPTTNSDYPAAIAEFGRATDTADAAARARALRRVAENGIFARQRFNQAFVLMEYFGYLNRDPNTGRDTDFAGYQFWLDKLNRFNGNFQDAEMVKAFLSSIEYRARFPH